MDYKLIYSKRKTIAIQIQPDGQVVVRAPRGCQKAYLEEVLRKRKDWILQKQAELQTAARVREHLQPSQEEKARYLAAARAIFPERAAYFAAKMGVTYGRITIREQKTRWGSCSSKKNLNFNWKLLRAPKEVLDYVVVHELAHLKEMNHSRKFYQLIENIMPDYREQERWLKENGKYL